MTKPMQASQTAVRPDAARMDRSTWLPRANSAFQALGRWLKAPPSLENGHEGMQLSVFIAVHVIVWMLVALVLHAPSDVHDDMAEAFSWGRELQWGYYKHPPFWAWIARLWFSVFPTTDWAFELLSVANSAICLLGVWAVAGRHVGGARRWAAVLLLELVPFHHLLAFNYNANSIQLSVWPWAIYFFIVSFERRSFAASAGFGVLAACAVLSKYFGGVLLMSCFIAAISNPLARGYFRSYAPYISVLVFGICMAPHVAWSWAVVSGPLEYLATKTGYPLWFIVGKAATTVAGCILLHGVLVLALITVWRQNRERATGFLSPDPLSLLRRPRVRLLVVLAAAPSIITLLVSVFGNVRISTKFMLPLFTLVPLTWIVLYRAEFNGRSFRTIVRFVSLFMGGTIALALPLGIIKFRFNDRHFAEPRSILAHRITELWRLHTGVPLRVVAGTGSYALATVFYSADHPSDFTDFSQLKAPWIDDARLGRDGLAIICEVSDEACLRQLERLQTLSSVKVTFNDVSKRFLGIAGRPFSFVLLLVRPGQTIHSPIAACRRGFGPALFTEVSSYAETSSVEID